MALLMPRSWVRVPPVSFFCRAKADGGYVVHPTGLCIGHTLAMLIIAGAAANLCGSARAADDVLLFNGRNLDGWTAVLSKPGVKLEDIWSVADGGVLVCKGKRDDNIRGYIRTDRDDFENYTLTLE